MTETFINEQHRWLELMALNKDHIWQRCACGECYDEKRTLAKYRRMQDDEEIMRLTPSERLTQMFDAMSPMEREALLDKLIPEGVI